MIVRANQSVSRRVTGGRDTVAVRCPSHSVARAV
ncbi:MAG: threonylcarbamoyl-AMP synthase, partial [Acidimicrobiia bacterium]|nr:threonylcarbamoyl-AMP synthase [Acidimicrobiia bacterium]